MYLSRVEIDWENRRKTRDLSHMGAFHNWVEQCFPEEINNNVRTRKLWRLDKLGNKEYLLLLSENKPDLKQLETYGVQNTGEAKDYSSFIDTIHLGMTARFRVTVNPTISLKKEDGKRGRVVPHVSYDHQMQFLEERSLKNGFQLMDNQYDIVDRGYHLVRKSGNKDIRHIKVTYEGMLEIIELEKFKEILINGLGRKKAYGFGLMTIIPVTQNG